MHQAADPVSLLPLPSPHFCPAGFGISQLIEAVLTRRVRLPTTNTSADRQAAAERNPNMLTLINQGTCIRNSLANQSPFSASSEIPGSDALMTANNS